MVTHMLALRFLWVVRRIFIAITFCGVIASAQKPEERPLTHQEAQQELAEFRESYKNAYVPLIPHAQVRLDSGVVLTVTSAKVLKNRIRISGTLSNTTSTATPPSHYDLLLNESFEYQIARYQTASVRIGACGGPCVNSNVSLSVYVRSLAPGQSFAYSVATGAFSEQFPKAKVSDMVLVVSSPRR